MQHHNWYVIQVMTGREQALCTDLKEVLSKDLYEYCFVPMTEMQHRKEGKNFTVRKPLFPGYLFIISDNIEEIAIQIRETSKFKRILRTGESFTPLEKNEAMSFRALTDENFVIAISIGFIVGDVITVTEGPLKGYEGRIKKIDRHKCTAFVEMPFLGKDTRIRIPLEIVDKR